MTLYTVCLLFVVGAVVAREHALPGGPAHEARGWVIKGRAPSSAKVELIIAVKQQNLAALEELLLDVSDPNSRNYGQHASQDEVNSLVQPSAESVTAVQRWISSYSSSSAHALTPNGDLVSVVVRVEEAERLLDCQYHEFAHPQTGSSTYRTLKYTLPASVEGHVDFVAPTLVFPPVGSGPAKTRATVDVVTPAFLKELYAVNETGDGKGTTQAVASFLGQYYNKDDLSKFWSKNGLASTTVTNVPSSEPEGYGIEASLDVQYITAMGTEVPTEVWYTEGEQPHNPGSEPFIKWLAAVASDTSPPNLFSISYGDEENGVDFDYAQRCGVEFQKAGARGITLLVASGDSGVGCGTTFVPTFPASCPWITAVGATTGGTPGKFPTGETVVGFSGGGFSNYFPRPAFQEAGVAAYKKTSGLPNQERWNATGAGFPDISAQGVDFSTCIRGLYTPVSGTSAACPTAGGIFGLLNNMRVKAGKAPLGFINPLLWGGSVVSALADCTAGQNDYCGDANGFMAQQGWDPASGWGTPNFQKLLGFLI